MGFTAIFGVVLLVIAYILKILFNALLTRNLSLDLYGDFQLFFRTLLIVGLLNCWGSDKNCSIFISNYISRNNTKEIAKFIYFNIRKWFKVSLILVSIAAICQVASYFIYTTAPMFAKQLGFYTSILYISPIIALSILFSSHMLAVNRPLLSIFIKKILIYIALCVVFYLLFYVFKSPSGFDTIFWGVLLSSSLLALASLAGFYYVYVKIIELNITRLFKGEYSRWHSFWNSTSWKLVINNVLFTLICLIDIVALKLLERQIGDVAKYAVAFMLASTILLIPKGVIRFMIPKIYYTLRVKKDVVEIQREINFILILMFPLLVVFISLIAFFANDLLKIFGDNYMQANRILYYLLGAMFFASLSKVPVYLLIYYGNEKLVDTLSLIGFAFSIIVVFTLTYFFGLFGTMIATLLTCIFQFSLFVIFVRKRLKLKPLGIF